jgi:hypothetical protein
MFAQSMVKLRDLEAALFSLFFYYEQHMHSCGVVPPRTRDIAIYPPGAESMTVSPPLPPPPPMPGYYYSSSSYFSPPGATTSSGESGSGAWGPYYDSSSPEHDKGYDDGRGDSKRRRYSGGGGLGQSLMSAGRSFLSTIVGLFVVTVVSSVLGAFVR